jgi:hypothetical protein
MWTPVVMGMIAYSARVLCWAAESWILALRERERCRNAVALMLAAGPGSDLADRRSDGSLLVVRRGDRVAKGRRG